LHLSALMERSGFVLATDPRASSLAELRRRTKATRVGHIVARKANVVADAVDDEPFDGVLVDAPCSGLGTWNRNPDARWRMTADGVRKHAKLQKQLLSASAKGVRPEGTLVYAVCTLTNDETTEVVAHFLDQHKDFQLEPFSHPLSREKTDGTAWIWPWMGPCNGMFVARFRKV
jgi:16S rRNA (cytosine967-C5)-methyltransferase